jgi:hypothetical protein
LTLMFKNLALGPKKGGEPRAHSLHALALQLIKLREEHGRFLFNETLCVCLSVIVWLIVCVCVRMYACMHVYAYM